MQSFMFLFNIRAIALYYMYMHGIRRQLIVLINLTSEWQHLQRAVLSKKLMHLLTVLYTTTPSFVALVFCPSGLSLHSYIVDGIP